MHFRVIRQPRHPVFKNARTFGIRRRFEVYSAGVAPTDVRQEAIEAMAEIGIDISQHRPKPVDDFLQQEFDYAITVCDNANEQCPTFRAKTRRLHWSFPDPAVIQGDHETRLTAFREIHNQIRECFKTFFGTV